MDSLLANYASSDDEEQSPAQRRIVPARTVNSVSESGKDEDFLPTKRDGIFNSLPPPKSSLFNSLPPPKPQSGFAIKRDFDEQIVEKSKPKPSSSSSLFTSIPPPKPSSSSSKKVVQFRPPTVTNPNSGKFDDEDEDADEGELERQRKRAKESISTASPASFLSSIPAPRHTATLGTMSSASGTNRRSIIETEAPSSNANKTSTMKNNTDTVVNNSNAKYLKEEEDPTNEITNGGAVDYTAGSSYDYSYGDGQYVDYTNSGGSYGNYGDHGQYENNWANSIPLPEVSAVAEEALRVPGRRGRKDTPLQIIEVKQDELMKNRPRQDQVKSTGIAFGPQYEPTSTKGKPTKLHKRKHQIGSLLFDMRQKESELAERRSKGFLTKAQTQAKYGW